MMLTGDAPTESRAVVEAMVQRVRHLDADFFERIGFDVDLYFNGNSFQDAALRQVKAFGGNDIAAMIWEAIEAKVGG